MSIKTILKMLAVAVPALWLGACSSTVDKPADQAQAQVDDAAERAAEEARRKAAEEAERLRLERLKAEQAAADAANKASMLLKQTSFYFEFDSSTVDDKYATILAAHGAYLASTPSVTVRLEGHADERGTPAYNQALGEQRAKAVAQVLASYGVSTSQIQIVSYGEEKPKAMGHDEASWLENRRVDIKY